MKLFSIAVAAATFISETSNAQRHPEHSWGRPLRGLSEENEVWDSLSLSLSMSMMASGIATQGSTTTNIGSKSGKSSKAIKSSLGFDPPQWEEFDVMAKAFDEGYIGNYETIDTSEISAIFSKTGSAFVFDLGSTGSLFRRRGAVITLSEIRTIWYELSPIAGDYNGVVVKSIGDSLVLLFEKVSDGLMATRAMYLGLIARWRAKVELACGGETPEEWCGDEEDERKRFFNTAAVGGGYGEMLLIPEGGTYIDAYGSAVNNAVFAAEDEAKHGEFMIDEVALQQLLQEAGGVFQPDACSNEAVEWTTGDLGVHRFIVKVYTFGCYYTVCFDAECKIPDDE